MAATHELGEPPDRPRVHGEAVARRRDGSAAALATRRSHAAASWVPPPIAGPFTAADHGDRRSGDRAQHPVVGLEELLAVDAVQIGSGAERRPGTGEDDRPCSRGSLLDRGLERSAEAQAERVSLLRAVQRDDEDVLVERLDDGLALGVGLSDRWSWVDPAVWRARPRDRRP